MSIAVKPGEKPISRTSDNKKPKTEEKTKAKE